MRLRGSIAQGIRNEIFGFVTSLGFARRRLSRSASMLDIRYADSPILAQDRPSLGASVLGGSDEAPTVRDWFHFGHGPTPGERAPDVWLDEDDQDSPRLLSMLDDKAHTLLLFDGAVASEAGYHGFVQLSARLSERFGERVAVRVIVPHGLRPPALARWEGQVVLDANGTVHERYGARSECLYLVRPDGYVAYRCQPADGDKLMAYLEQVLV